MTKLINIFLVFLVQKCATFFVNETKEYLYGTLLVDVGYPKSGDIPLLNRKVFKGTRVSIREHPYVASVRRQYSHYCTASILTKNLLVTVAHPLAGVPVSELGAVVGENYSDRGSLVHTVVLLLIHEEFDPYTLASDIALLRVYEDITYRGSVKPIELIAPSASLSESRAFVTGWGRCDSMSRELCLPRTSKYFPEEKIDPMLRSINFKVDLSSLYCEGYLRHEIIMRPGMLCVGQAREEDPVCPCLAVPGAPLVVRARLVGLQSWGFGCGYHHDLPLVYTDLRYYQPWLVHNIPILRKIAQSNLTRIFRATRGYILSQWLAETRLIRPELEIRVDKDIVPTKLDKVLAKLRGDVYDIRDYISNGVFRKRKKEMYDTMRQHAHAVSSITESQLELRPFLSYNVYGFNVTQTGVNATEDAKNRS
ncbi:hypothetical protein O3G_MSEX002545 [Manduca sexta]|uniref:Peptidase S1 domain-containing protein n=1 Tax=Manduca sexta TaxID=7130 RepID=A0A922CDG2_MANSE|nr:hypothetical protein O3G_MSEX002545 [Manduca sexta]